MLRIEPFGPTKDLSPSAKKLKPMERWPRNPWRTNIIEGMEPRDISFQIIGDQAIGPYIDALKINQIKVNALREEAMTLTGKNFLKRLLLTGIPGTTPEQGKLF